MDIKKTILQHKQVCSLVSEKRIKQSLDILAEMLTGNPQAICEMSMIMWS